MSHFVEVVGRYVILADPGDPTLTELPYTKSSVRKFPMGWIAWITAALCRRHELGRDRCAGLRGFGGTWIGLSDRRC